MEKMNRKEAEAIQEHITNRILFNFMIAIIAYAVLLILWRSNVTTLPVFLIAGGLAVCAVIFFILAKMKSKKFLNYAIASLALSFAAAFLKLSLIVSKIIGINTFAQLMEHSFWRILFNARTDVIIVAVLGAVYLLIMLIYNIIQYISVGQKKK